MSNKLHAFLNPEMPQEKEIFVSDRFKDEDGKTVLFRVRPISQEENAKLQKAAKRMVTTKQGTTEELDTAKYTKLLILAGTAFPDFRDNELCEAYGTKIPEEVPGKMLLAGEYHILSEAISDLSGFNAAAQKEIGEEAKN